MIVKGKTPSWNKTTNKDCFGIGGDSNLDHIYPASKGGSNGAINMQVLSVHSNEKKNNLTKGKIGTDWRFSILKQTNKEGLVFGIMFIRNKNWDTNIWKEVTPIRN